VKRTFFLVTLAIILAGIVVFGVGDIAISFADIRVPENEVTSGEANNCSASASIPNTELASNKVNNASVSATIVIKMTGVLDQ